MKLLNFFVNKFVFWVLFLLLKKSNKKPINPALLDIAKMKYRAIILLILVKD
jgi:hypothetical protein